MLLLHKREMEAVGFNAAEPLFVASAIFSVTQASPTNLQKIITWSAEIMGAGGVKVNALPFSLSLPSECCVQG